MVYFTDLCNKSKYQQFSAALISYFICNSVAKKIKMIKKWSKYCHGSSQWTQMDAKGNLAKRNKASVCESPPYRGGACVPQWTQELCCQGAFAFPPCRVSQGNLILVKGPENKQFNLPL